MQLDPMLIVCPRALVLLDRIPQSLFESESLTLVTRTVSTSSIETKQNKLQSCRITDWMASINTMLISVKHIKAMFQLVNGRLNAQQ